MLDARGFDNFRDSPSPHNPAHSDQQYARCAVFFQRSFEVLHPKVRVVSKVANQSFVVRDAGFSSHNSFCPFPTVLDITERQLDVRGLFAFVATGKEPYTSLSQHRVIHAINHSPNPSLPEAAT